MFVTCASNALGVADARGIADIGAKVAIGSAAFRGVDANTFTALLGCGVAAGAVTSAAGKGTFATADVGFFVAGAAGAATLRAAAFFGAGVGAALIAGRAVRTEQPGVTTEIAISGLAGIADTIATAVHVTTCVGDRAATCVISWAGEEGAATQAFGIATDLTVNAAWVPAVVIGTADAYAAGIGRIVAIVGRAALPLGNAEPVDPVFRRHAAFLTGALRDAGALDAGETAVVAIGVDGAALASGHTGGNPLFEAAEVADLWTRSTWTTRSRLADAWTGLFGATDLGFGIAARSAGVRVLVADLAGITTIAVVTTGPRDTDYPVRPVAQDMCRGQPTGTRIGGTAEFFAIAGPLTAGVAATFTVIRTNRG